MVTAIELPIFDELLLLFFCQQFKDEPLALLSGKVVVFELDHFAVQTKIRRRTRREMEVRGLLFLHKFEKLIELCHSIPL